MNLSRNKINNLITLNVKGIEIELELTNRSLLKILKIIVEEYLGTSLLVRSNKREILYNRYKFIATAYFFTNKVSQSEIGNTINKDHATIHHAMKMYKIFAEMVTAEDRRFIIELYDMMQYVEAEFNNLNIKIERNSFYKREYEFLTRKYLKHKIKRVER